MKSFNLIICLKGLFVFFFFFDCLTHILRLFFKNWVVAFFIFISGSCLSTKEISRLPLIWVASSLVFLSYFFDGLCVLYARVFILVPLNWVSHLFYGFWMLNHWFKGHSHFKIIGRVLFPFCFPFTFWSTWNSSWCCEAQIQPFLPPRWFSFPWLSQALFPYVYGSVSALVIIFPLVPLSVHVHSSSHCFAY